MGFKFRIRLFCKVSLHSQWLPISVCMSQASRKNCMASDENVLSWIMVMVTQWCKFTENNWIVHLKKQVNFVVYKLYLKKAISKPTKVLKVGTRGTQHPPLYTLTQIQRCLGEVHISI